ncbi:MAG: sigma-70 family RNA polymerase sigma factor [Chloroflexota bacterium]|nr:sigma-70 family RNA polymerase sigma factor [Chloroflexota bacterium]
MWTAKEEAGLDARWEALYEQSRPLLYRTAALMVGAAEAEEVVQETFERALREVHFFDQVREPLAWLRTVAARRALGRLRRRRVWERVRLRVPRDESLEPWERADLARALRELPARDRIAVVLRYYHDASYEEIAAATGMAVASVGPILTRARARMREALA